MVHTCCSSIWEAEAGVLGHSKLTEKFSVRALQWPGMVPQAHNPNNPFLKAKEGDCLLGY